MTDRRDPNLDAQPVADQESGADLAALWLLKNRDAIHAYNEHVKTAGAFGDDARRF